MVLRVVDLFAGVGGFRLGLERADKEYFETVWMNQWEPSKKKQDAYECYKKNFTEGHFSNEDIGEVDTEELKELRPDLMVGGFPCQDYSVARSSKGTQGIEGKKGVLFWEIVRLAKDIRPKYLLLENVDRLLITPSKQRGRDFAVMLAAFRDIGYNVEWRVINAAHYGGAQRRRRVFIFVTRDDLEINKKIRETDSYTYLYKEGFFAKEFPVRKSLFKLKVPKQTLDKDIVKVSDNFKGEILSAGYMIDGDFYTSEVKPNVEQYTALGDILEDEVQEEYYLTEEERKKFKYLRGRKEIERVTEDGFKYIYKEGKMSEVDELHLPSRTILTSEGSITRTTHIVNDGKGIRYLTPVECERLNRFPDNWTKGITDRMRYFTMGNALDVNLVKRMGKRLKEIDK